MENDANDLRRRLFDAVTDAVDHYDSGGESLNVQFPYGHIRKIGVLSKRWPYLSRNRARTVACTIQLCDVNRFFLDTFKVKMTAGTMWEWHVSVPLIAVIETLCYEVVRKERWGSRSVSFNRCIDILHENGVFETEFTDILHELRNYRNEVHLYLKGHVEMGSGLPEKHDEAANALKGVEDRLKVFYGGND